MNKIIHHSHILALLCLATASVHADSNTVIATINTGITPIGIAITNDSRTAYVANNNSYEIYGQDSVSVLDLKHNLPLQTLTDPSFSGPYSITLNAKNTKAYVTNNNSTTISIINTETNTVCDVIDGFDGPSGMVITSRGNRAYVPNYGSDNGVGRGNGTTVNVVNLSNDTIIGAPITVGQAPTALAISPDDAFVYVVNNGSGDPETGTVSIIEACTNTVIATISGFSGPTDISLTPDGKYAYIPNNGDDVLLGTTVSIVDLRNNTIIDTVTVGISPFGTALTPDCRYAYVTNSNFIFDLSNPETPVSAPGQGTVSIINTEDNEVISPTIVVGQSPFRIAIAPNGKYAYVTNNESNTVSVIKLKHK